MFQTLFGPVPSRRLGMSLGIDLVPRKVCSLNCVYCEVGPTTTLTLERKEYIPFKQVKKELTEFFQSQPDPDYITFSGSGEPTLNSRIGDVLTLAKTLRPEIPVAVLTNGTLLYNPDVRHQIHNADVVLPSLDSATKTGFLKINRPQKNLKLEDYIQGLIDFRKEYPGQIWLEVFILPGYNDSKEELKALKQAILEINPDRIQLNTLDRPGTIKNLHSASRQDLQQIIDFWALDHVEIIAAAPLRKNIPSYRGDIESTILQTIARRPCTALDLSQLLGIHINEVNKYLDVLDAEHKIESISGDRGFFYQISKK